MEIIQLVVDTIGFVYGFLIFLFVSLVIFSVVIIAFFAFIVKILQDK